MIDEDFLVFNDVTGEHETWTLNEDFINRLCRQTAGREYRSFTVDEIMSYRMVVVYLLNRLREKGFVELDGRVKKQWWEFWK